MEHSFEYNFGLLVGVLVGALVGVGIIALLFRPTRTSGLLWRS